MKLSISPTQDRHLSRTCLAPLSGARERLEGCPREARGRRERGVEELSRASLRPLSHLPCASLGRPREVRDWHERCPREVRDRRKRVHSRFSRASLSRTCFGPHSRSSRISLGHPRERHEAGARESSFAPLTGLSRACLAPLSGARERREAGARELFVPGPADKIFMRAGTNLYAE